MEQQRKEKNIQNFIMVGMLLWTGKNYSKRLSK